jgi:hypothetical protein
MFARILRGSRILLRKVTRRPSVSKTTGRQPDDRPSTQGMLISEVAMREKRPGHIVLRASKMLDQLPKLPQNTSGTHPAG